MNEAHGAANPDKDASTDSSWMLMLELARRWRSLTLVPIGVGTLALGVAFLIPPTYTARTTLLLPQQSQGSMASALSSLGSLAGIAGAAAGIKSPADQYIAFLQSRRVADRLIAQFNLSETYGTPLPSLTRKALAGTTRIAAGKKDNLITIEVDDKSPKQAADLANQYVVELRKLMSELAITEAQQRRVFFEQQANDARKRLQAAQQALEGSGVTLGTIRSEPRAAAESYAKLQANVTAAEVRLKVLLNAYSSNSAEVQNATAVLNALRDQLQKLEGNTQQGQAGSSDYISRYREFKYQETLFELFSKQLEIARVDEARDGSLIQVIDVAEPPDRKSKPSRALIALGATVAAFVLQVLTLVARLQYFSGDRGASAQRRIHQFREALAKR